mmetsp:Transcript_61725/g.133740  ORF Transcript_61725/g.133740 Transcript_61725/m.133740 type:complete len:182 (+) Transcript_61725:1218-1763(+)
MNQPDTMQVFQSQEELPQQMRRSALKHWPARGPERREQIVAHGEFHHYTDNSTVLQNLNYSGEVRVVHPPQQIEIAEKPVALAAALQNNANHALLLSEVMNSAESSTEGAPAREPSGSCAVQVVELARGTHIAAGSGSDTTGGHSRRSGAAAASAGWTNLHRTRAAWAWDLPHNSCAISKA